MLEGFRRHHLLSLGLEIVRGLWTLRVDLGVIRLQLELSQLGLGLLQSNLLLVLELSRRQLIQEL